MLDRVRKTGVVLESFKGEAVESALELLIELLALKLRNPLGVVLG